MCAEAPEETLIQLWEKARSIAIQCCGGTLASLRAGKGGFYQADDFFQDLFLCFRRLLTEWGSTGRPVDELWGAWRKRLFMQGASILQRCPQRLWHKPEITLDPLMFELYYPEEDQNRRLFGSLGTTFNRLLTETDTPEVVCERREHSNALLEEWRNLNQYERETISLYVIQGIDAEEAGKRLGITKWAVWWRMRNIREKHRLTE